MEYRKLPHGREAISVLGLGSSSLGSSGEEEAEKTVALALENGVNFFDLAAGDAVPFPALGRAVSGCRDRVYFQVHFGADYRSGKYGWTLDLEEIKRSVDWQLKALQTDFIDFGFLHCIDEEADLETALAHGTLAYMEDLKRQGVIRHIGLSSHTPAVVQKVLDMGILDMLMFSINPAYDYRHGEFAVGSGDERAALYRRCEAEGVGISVMKAFSGGQLLKAETSPFGQALTEYQCIQYALDRPGVLTVLPGVRNREDLKRLLGFFSAPEEEKDYAVLGSFTPPGVRRELRLLQPLPALPGRPGRGAYQQILRSGLGRGRAGEKPLCQFERQGRGLPRMRALRFPLPLPCGADAEDAGNRRLFWGVIALRRVSGGRGRHNTGLPHTYGHSRLEEYDMAVKQTAGRRELGGFAPKFAQLNDDVLFGEVWSREDALSLRDRSLVTVVALLSQGLVDTSFQYHLLTAKQNGITRQEIAEILTHAAFYAGWPKAWAAFRMAKEVWGDEEGEDAGRGGIFGLGAPNDAYAQYFVGKSYLKPLAREGGVAAANVTFEPGCRNNWHIHHASQDGGQILLCTAGRGWYQEWGQEARRLLPGDAVEIPAGVKHWHGAAKDSWFSHLAVEVPGEQASNEWLEPVSDEQYDSLE